MTELRRDGQTVRAHIDAIARSIYAHIHAGLAGRTRSEWLIEDWDIGGLDDESLTTKLSSYFQPFLQRFQNGLQKLGRIENFDPDDLSSMSSTFRCEIFRKAKPC